MVTFVSSKAAEGCLRFTEAGERLAGTADIAFSNGSDDDSGVIEVPLEDAAADEVATVVDTASVGAGATDDAGTVAGKLEVEADATTVVGIELAAEFTYGAGVSNSKW